MIFVTTQHCDEWAQCCTVGRERSSMIYYDKGYGEAASILQIDNTRLCLSDFRTRIYSNNFHAFTVAGDNSTSADGRETESSATLLYLGDGRGSSSI